MFRSVSLVVFLSLPLVAFAASKQSGKQNTKQNCTQAAEYLSQATARFEANDRPVALEYLQLSIDSCPTFDAYAKLAQEYANSIERSDRAQAAAAFVKAHEVAPNNTARATMLYEYANLLVSDGDPQNAYPLIKQARQLAPSNADIRTLEAALDKEMANPTVQQLTRGLAASLYQPLRIQPAAARATKVNAVKAPPRLVSNGPSISIQINFETGSNAVDEATQPNIAKLAEVLATRPASEKFVFVGHADERGTEALNLPLSADRARAISDSVVKLNPSLANRIQVVGRGSEEPFDTGHDEAAWQKNRRLQVFIDK